MNTAINLSKRHFGLQEILNRDIVDGRLSIENQTYPIARMVASIQATFLEGKQTRTVEKTYQIPKFTDKMVLFPATTWDAVKRSVCLARDRVNQWLANARYSGWMFSRTHRTQLEQWLLDVEIPYRMEKVVSSRKTGEKTVSTVVNQVNVCPHWHKLQTEKDCVTFLMSKVGDSNDADFLRAAIPALNDLMKLSMDSSHFHALINMDERFRVIYFRLEGILKRHRAMQGDFPPFLKS